jgi:hypothetical protein
MPQLEAMEKILKGLCTVEASRFPRVVEQLRQRGYGGILDAIPTVARRLETEHLSEEEPQTVASPPSIDHAFDGDLSQGFCETISKDLASVMSSCARSPTLQILQMMQEKLPTHRDFERQPIMQR